MQVSIKQLAITTYARLILKKRTKLINFLKNQS